MTRIEICRARGKSPLWWRNMVKCTLTRKTLMYDTEWNRNFIRKFLTDNGATLSPNFWDFNQNYIEFENDEDATAFLLRWS